MIQDRPLLLLFLACATACDRSTNQAMMMLPDSLGAEAPDGWNVREVARVGSRDGRPGEIPFELIRAVQLDSAGTLYALDLQAAQLHVFARDGGHVQTIGRRGRGPGEFLRPSGVVVTGDGHVWVADPGNVRYSEFDSSGNLVATYRSGLRAGFMLRWGAVVAENGTMYEPHNVLHVGASRIGPVYVGVVKGSGTTTGVDTIARIPAYSPPTWPVTVGMANGGVRESGFVPAPFSATQHEFFDSRGGYWHARTDELRFIRLSPAGDTLLVVERHVVPRTVEKDDIEDAVQKLKERFGEGLQVDEGDIPSTMPFWTTFFVDDAGRLWAQRFTEFRTDRASHPTPWEIYNHEGEFLGALVLRIATTPVPVSRAGRLAGVIRDSTGIEYVAVYDLGVREQQRAN